MKHYLYVLSLIFAITASAPGANGNDKLFGGGGIGASFGSVTAVQVAPFIGYQIRPKTSAGLGATYTFQSGFGHSTHIYGGSVFAEQFLGKNIFLRGEYELLSLESAYFDALGQYPDQKRFLHHGILTGAGYKTRVSDRSSFFILAMVNLTQTSNSPYSLPIIKIGFAIH